MDSRANTREHLPRLTVCSQGIKQIMAGGCRRTDGFTIVLMFPFCVFSFFFPQDPYGVAVGGTVGHCLCTGLVVIGGRMIAQKISVRTGK